MEFSFVCDVFQQTVFLSYLDLSRNELRFAGGAVIGEALLTKETVLSLDLRIIYAETVLASLLMVWQ
jgi:hypothetical protein